MDLGTGVRSPVARRPAAPSGTEAPSGSSLSPSIVPVSVPVSVAVSVAARHPIPGDQRS